MYKGIVHIHSRYSFDSMLKLEDILKFAVTQNLNFVALTDHNTLNGSKELLKLSKQNKHDIEIVIGGEYQVEGVELIALFINNEPDFFSIPSFTQSVKSQGGIILFPHPIRARAVAERIVGLVDFVEIFNSRIDDFGNDYAINLAEKYKKRIYYSSDAHSNKNLNNVLVQFKNSGSLKESFLMSDIMPLRLNKTSKFDIVVSQMIKAVKTKSIRLFVSQARVLIKHLFERGVKV